MIILFGAVVKLQLQFSKTKLKCYWN